MEKKLSYVRTILVLLILVWTLLIASISALSLYRNYGYAQLVAIQSAKTSANKDLAFRSWVASHGGVYVPVDERTKPNKYLSNIKNRDFHINGQDYTLMNPAYTLVQMMKDYSKLYGVKTKITSRLLLNPKNRADAWESYALEKISIDKKEFYELSDINNVPYLRLMKPLIVQKSCLKCHSKQGYKVGDIRGGISVSIPMNTLYNDIFKKNSLELSIFALIWFLGVLIFFYFYKKIYNTFLERQKMYEQYIYGLVDIIEKRDYYTAGHSKRVAEYSKKLAKAMDYGKEEQELLYKAAMLHDIGKIAIPDSIFLKPGKLNDLEYDMIKEHVNISYEMIKNIDVFNDMAEIIRNHHEHFDGNGYPRGLKGDESPLLAQILCLCDAFDAMTTSRVYKKRKDVLDALKEISALSGKQFNPTVVKYALKTFENIVIQEQNIELFENRLEKERFQYFFKDTLTGLFNKDYLEKILLEKHDFIILYTISLKNFTQFNKKYGWQEGDLKLKKIAHLLSKNFSPPNGLSFRIYGDDFIVLSDKLMAIDKILKSIKSDFNLFDIDIVHKTITIEKSKSIDLKEICNDF